MSNWPELNIYCIYLVAGLFICVLLCTNIISPLTKHVLPVLLTFIQCDSRVLKLLQNAWQIHHRDHNLCHSTEVFHRYAICGWKIMCCIKHILTNSRQQICINKKEQAVLTGTNQSFLSFYFLSCLCQKVFPLFVTVRNCTLNLWEGSVDGSSYILPGIPFILGRDSSAAFPSDYSFFLLHQLSKKKAFLVCPIRPSLSTGHVFNEFKRHLSERETYLF